AGTLPAGAQSVFSPVPFRAATWSYEESLASRNRDGIGRRRSRLFGRDGSVGCRAVTGQRRRDRTGRAFDQRKPGADLYANRHHDAESVAGKPPADLADLADLERSSHPSAARNTVKHKGLKARIPAWAGILALGFREYTDSADRFRSQRVDLFDDAHTLFVELSQTLSEDDKTVFFTLSILGVAGAGVFHSCAPHFDRECRTITARNRTAVNRQASG